MFLEKWTKQIFSRLFSHIAGHKIYSNGSFRSSAKEQSRNYAVNENIVAIPFRFPINLQVQTSSTKHERDNYCKYICQLLYSKYNKIN